MYAKLKPILDKQVAAMMAENETEHLVDKAWHKIENDMALNRAKKVAFTEEVAEITSPDAAREPPIMYHNTSDDTDVYYKAPASQFWTTVHLFISSTFRDMGAEREYIVKKVVPELADWAEKRGVRLVECDLRWGVPKHSTSVDTIETCLGELEMIKKNSKGQPLFLCLLGDRYGWIPNLTDIPEDVAKRYDWVDSCSITHMEILQGALRCKNRNALFCLRNPKFAAGLTDEQAELYLDKGQLEIVHLAKLKKKIGTFLPDPRDQIYTYDANLISVADDAKKTDIEFKPEFGEKVLKFFRTAIERLFADRADFKRPNAVEEENYYQWTYLEKQIEGTFGIDSWTQELTAYLTGSFTGENGSMALREFEHTGILTDELSDPEACANEQKDTWPCVGDEESGWSSHPICLISEPGHGKTAVMSCSAKSIIQAGEINVFFHYCGPTVSYTAIMYALFLRRLIQFLLRVLEIPKTVDDVFDESVLYQTKTVHDLLKELQKHQDKKVVIFIDAPENLSEINSSIQTTWRDFLPSRFPSNCTVVMSTTNDPNLWIHNYLCLAEASMLRMPDVPVELRSTIASKYFEAYTKKLDKEQLSLLVNKDGAHLPLWLKLACEELRVFGNFREVTSKIRDFAPTLDGLLGQVFTRLMKESPDVPIGKFLRYLAITPNCLTEEFLPLLLGNPDADENRQVLPITLARLRLVLKNMVLFGLGQRLIILPFHMALTKAARSLMTPTLKDVAAAKWDLAFFMMNHADLNARFEWATHIVDLLWESNHRKELLRFLQYDQCGRNGISYRSLILLKFRCTMPVNHMQKSMIVPFKCCYNCSLMMDFELNGRHTDFCWLCKTRVVGLLGTPAVACASHREYPLKVGEYTCRICNLFRGPQYTQWTPLLLCQRCATFSTCCHMSVEQSHFRFPYCEDEEAGTGSRT